MTNFSLLSLKKFFANSNKVLLLWAGVFIVIIITFLAAYYKVRMSPQTLALHYNVVVGVDMLGNRNRLYQVPGTALIIAAMNICITYFLPREQKVYVTVLAAVSLISALMLLSAMLFLYRVN